MQIENMNKKWNDNEKSKDIDFQLYFSMMKSNKMSWELFFQIMDNMISSMELPESKKLIFDLLQEIKEFKEQEAEYKEKLRLNNELEQSNEILRKENESLKNECDEFKRKLASFSVQKEKLNDLPNDSASLAFSYDENFESKMELVTDIKIEEFDIDENNESVSTEIIGNVESEEEQNHGNIQDCIKINHLSVRLIRLSESQLENYLKVNHEPINNRLNDTKSTSMYRCNKCEKSFGKAKYLKAHNKFVHEGLKKYKCNECEKAFARPSLLKTHKEIVHEGLKKHKCNKCGKLFGQSGDLKKHNDIVHEGLKNFKCNKCGKLFGKAGDLNRHTVEVHEGLKKYICYKCSKAFSRAGYMRTHIMVVHEGLK